MTRSDAPWRRQWPSRDAAEAYLRRIDDPATRERTRARLGLDDAAPIAAPVVHPAPTPAPSAAPRVDEVQAPLPPARPALQAKGAPAPSGFHMPGVLSLTIPAMPCWQKRKDHKGVMRRAEHLPKIPKLVGYYTNGKEPNFDRSREYADWKKHVDRLARGLILPPATRETPVRVDIWCYFPSGTHSDPENVRKGIVDALYPRDKNVYGYHHHPLYDAEQPRVLVTITPITNTLFGGLT